MWKLSSSNKRINQKNFESTEKAYPNSFNNKEMRTFFSFNLLQRGPLPFFCEKFSIWICSSNKFIIHPKSGRPLFSNQNQLNDHSEFAHFWHEWFSLSPAVIKSSFLLPLDETSHSWPNFSLSYCSTWNGEIFAFQESMKSFWSFVIVFELVWFLSYSCMIQSHYDSFFFIILTCLGTLSFQVDSWSLFLICSLWFFIDYFLRQFQ